MTLSKLAKLANVSVSVVSKAFSGREDVSEAMREHVFAVAKKHGCFHQFYHVPYDKPVVAVIIPEIISQYYVHYMQCLKAHLEENGYTMLLSIDNFDRQMTGELIRYYTEYSKVNGIICFGDIPKMNRCSDTTIICIGTSEPVCEGVYRVFRNSHEGFEAAIGYLKNCGHRRIAYVGEPFTDGKLDKLKAILNAKGLDLDGKYCICSRFRFEEAGRDGVRRLWTLDEPPTAIIGAYGYITRGILSELAAHGLSVPEDVSVISLDNEPDPISATLDVGCVPSDIEVVCGEIIKLLKKSFHEDPSDRGRTVEISTAFYEGNTVKKI